MNTGAVRADVRNWHWLCAAAFGFGSVVVLCALANAALAAGWAWQCPVMNLFHLPCPSCGTTRALGALSELQIFEALQFNPLIVLAMPLAPVCFIVRDRLAGSRAAWVIFIGGVFLNWLYLLFFLPR